MSVHYSSAVWKWRAPESSIKLVLLHLADLANHEGLCWPSQARICEETGLSRSTVNRSLTWLEGAKVISRAPGNSSRSTRYNLCMEKLAAGSCELSHGETLPPRDTPTMGLPPLHGDTRTVSSERPLCPTVTHHPSVSVIEPPIPTKGGVDGGGLNPAQTNGATPSHPDQTEVSPEKKEKGVRPRDLCFEALVEIQGSRLKEIPRGERGQINRALHDIREVAPDLSAEELKKRAAVYREKMPGVTLTAVSLAAWWSRLAGNGNGAVLDAKPVVPAPENEPEGWRDAGKELYNCDTNALWPSWAGVPGANKTEIGKALKKKKGGGT